MEFIQRQDTNQTASCLVILWTMSCLSDDVFLGPLVKLSIAWKVVQTKYFIVLCQEDLKISMNNVTQNVKLNKDCH